ncbi:response regulator [Hungatella sp.]|uniref:response regulator n=1 Tax=Hungatella sp. TaxID=2613924 RepID=UPI003AB311ED
MKKIKIMVVDDDKDFLYLIQQTLGKEADFDVCSLCSSKKGALPAALTDSPDLVLMDLNLESTWMAWRLPAPYGSRQMPALLF